MTHVRTQIRAAAVALATGLTTTGANVFESRRIGLQETSLPCWIVRTEGEDHSPDGRAGSEIERDLELVFEGYTLDASGNDGQDTIDVMLSELEIAIDADRKLGGLLNDSRLIAIEPDTGDEDASQVIAGVRITYMAKYITNRGDPETAI